LAACNARMILVYTFVVGGGNNAVFASEVTAVSIRVSYRLAVLQTGSWRHFAHARAFVFPPFTKGLVFLH
jgi:hypothetical protein